MIVTPPGHRLRERIPDRRVRLNEAEIAHLRRMAIAAYADRMAADQEANRSSRHSGGARFWLQFLLPLAPGESMWLLDGEFYVLEAVSALGDATAAAAPGPSEVTPAEIRADAQALLDRHGDEILAQRRDEIARYRDAPEPSAFTPEQEARVREIIAEDRAAREAEAAQHQARHDLVFEKLPGELGYIAPDCEEMGWFLDATVQRLIAKGVPREARLELLREFFPEAPEQVERAVASIDPPPPDAPTPAGP